VCCISFTHRLAANSQLINLTFTSTIKGRVKEAEKSTRTRLLLLPEKKEPEAPLVNYAADNMPFFS
jgi:hypothetical protein